jgi:hypothetical protein
MFGCLDASSRGQVSRRSVVEGIGRTDNVDFYPRYAIDYFYSIILH